MPVSRRRLPLLVTLALLVAAAGARAGSLSGSVTDAQSGEGLIGVDLVLVGTDHRTMTDLDGDFLFADVPDGVYDLRVTYLGYNTRFLSGVSVSGTVASLQVTLESFKAYQGDDMVVAASRILNTESALLTDRQQSAVVGDAISAAQISRSPDGNAGDALKRVPGLTVNDGKYVYVRGVTDRYNVTEVNGVTMSGVNVEIDRKSFNFDMVPANLLANVVVVKTATPDLPGDFAGGLVRIGTLEFPEKATTSVSVSIADTRGTTGQPYSYDSREGSSDFWGVDDGGRDFPEHLLKHNQQIGSSTYNNELARGLSNRWTTEQRTAPPRLSFGLSHGNKVPLAGFDLGYLGALTYRNKYDFEDVTEERQLSPEGEGQTLKAGFNTSHTQVNWGGLANLFLRRAGHRIGLTNLFTRTTDSQIDIMKDGQTSDIDSFDFTTLSWHERRQLVSKLDGRHQFWSGAGGINVHWAGFYGEAAASEPDRRYLAYNNDFESPQMNQNMRTWTDLTEFRRGWQADLVWSLAEDDLDEPHKVKFKSGYQRTKRQRAFRAESWASLRTRRNGALALLPPDTIFHPDNYNEVPDPRAGQLWNLGQDNTLSGIYDGEADLEAFYLMSDVPFGLVGEEFRLVGGARVEDSRQFVEALTDRATPALRDTARLADRDVLPSVSLTWIYDPSVNVRLGYYKSVNRPQLRELAPVQRRNYRDFTNTVGNPDLKRALIDNYDVRLEYFPGDGEVLAVSGFYKDIADAIEDSLFTGPDSPYSTWSNAPEAKNWGFELEARVKLDFWSPTRGFMVFGNYARIWSEVGYYDTEDRTDAIRPLSGQAPWTVNMGLGWDRKPWGTSVSVLFNKVGRRLQRISNFKYEYVYLEPRNKLDVVVSQTLWGNHKIKFSAKDILAEDVVKTSGTEDATYVYSSISQGAEYKVSVSVRF
jgi:outer membrane receptor protein involved in Fe transport